MLPLTKVAHGYLLVLVDIRIGPFDLLIDLVGWLLMIAGLGRLAGSVDPRFTDSRVWAMIGAVLSVADLVGATALPVLGLPYGIVIVVVSWKIATALMHRARDFGDAATASTFDLLRWLLPSSQVVAVLALFSGSEGLVLLLLLVSLGVGIWFLVKLYRSARLPYLQPQGEPAGG